MRVRSTCDELFHASTDLHRLTCRLNNTRHAPLTPAKLAYVVVLSLFIFHCPCICFPDRIETLFRLHCSIPLPPNYRLSALTCIQNYSERNLMRFKCA